MGQKVSREDFIWTYTEQPHMSRREKIVRAHPEIKELFGVDPSFKYVVVAMVLAQTFLAWLLQDEDWLLLLLMGYCCGGVINHALTLAIHDISHNTAFGNDRAFANRLLGMVANLPMAVPISVSFKKYHVEHHRYLGESDLDTDLPTEMEARFFTTPLRKILWLSLQPFFYAFRPLIAYPKAPTDMEIVNAGVQIVYDFLIVFFFGWKALFYLFFSLILALGVHPSAGHFITEHYIFDERQETYSYYGLWNLCTFNVGYHVEHHDFPYIPGRDLPKVRKIAPEFYDNLISHKSWTYVVLQFIFSKELGPYSRLRRKNSINPSSRLWGNHMVGEYVDALLIYIGFEEIKCSISRILRSKKNEKCGKKLLKVCTE